MRAGEIQPDTVNNAMGGVVNMRTEGGSGRVVGLEHCFLEFEGDECAVDG